MQPNALPTHLSAPAPAPPVGAAPPPLRFSLRSASAATFAASPSSRWALELNTLRLLWNTLRHTGWEWEREREGTGRQTGRRERTSKGGEIDNGQAGRERETSKQGSRDRGRKTTIPQIRSLITRHRYGVRVRVPQPEQTRPWAFGAETRVSASPHAFRWPPR